MKRALVTGGSGDLGQAICRQLANDGLHVIAHGCRHPEQAEAVVAAIHAAGGSAETAVFDVADATQTRRVLTHLLEAGPIQVLVNNAGVHADAPMAGMTVEQWRLPIEVGLHGFFNVTQPLLLPMISTRWGRIITISSLTGVIGNRGQTNYAAAKAGLHGATKALALELASRGITVNAIAPGLIAGGDTAAVFDADAIKRMVPMKRAGTPEEVAALAGFLASKSAAYLTGQIINLNGGMA
ncbi:MAG: 3-oxoacyl-ACP reductase FabG [Candidatus Contendobacter sp.]|jgi:3-oxoacyl-[acyl-carrier protein] reductase|nr:3-oxoacyl-ACP reductase FabG [Candidatus Contendobacter sp.]